MTQTTQTLLTPGTIDLAEKVIEQGQYPIGPYAIGVSTEVRTLTQLGVGRANGSNIILCHGGQRKFEEALRAQIQIAQQSAD